MTTAQAAESQNPYLEGFLAPVSTEVTATDLPVTGRIPEHLDGRYLRNGPNPVAEVDPATYHWFTGDAMVPRCSVSDPHFPCTVAEPSVHNKICGPSWPDDASTSWPR